MKAQKTQRSYQHHPYDLLKKEPKVIFSAIETIQKLEVEEKSKAKRFRDNHNLKIFTTETVPISNQRPMPSPPQTPDFSPNISRITKLANFKEALDLKQWVEDSQKRPEFCCLKLPMPKIYLV